MTNCTTAVTAVITRVLTLEGMLACRDGGTPTTQWPPSIDPEEASVMARKCPFYFDLELNIDHNHKLFEKLDLSQRNMTRTTRLRATELFFQDHTVPDVQKQIDADLKVRYSTGFSV